MAEYKYDEEGGQFLTFVLTFLLLVLVPLTYSLLAPSRTRSSKKGSWDARGQKIDLIRSAKKRSLLNPQISSKAVFVLAGWGIVAYLFQTILNTAANSSHAVYDPFQILGIAASATEKEIKKHYKRLSVKFHPDKLVVQEGQTKEEVESHYIELTKAYKALTDETIRKNFELYGHPDGKQEMSMGIALPRWVIDSQNNIYVLGMYAVVLGVGLPFLVARWWYGSRSKTKDGIVNSTAQTYFQHLRDDTNASRIFALLAISDEFTDAKLDKLGPKHRDEAAYAKLETEIRKKLSEFGPEWHLIDSFKSASVRKALVLLYAHTLRIESGNKRVEQEKLQYAAKAVQLINGLMSISLAHNWLETTLLLMQFTQCMVQAVPLQDLSSSELLQLPHMTPEFIKKLQESNSLAKLGIQGFWKIPDSERKSVLSNAGVGPNQYEQMVSVTSTWPRLELVDAFFKVSGERLVTTGAIVQFVVKLRLLPPKKDGSLLRDGRRLDAKRMDEESSVRPDEDDASTSDKKSGKDGAGAATSSEKEEGKQPIGFARAPYFWDERKPSWWVMIGDQKLDRVIVQPTKVSDIGPDQIRTYSVQFQAPPQAGLYTFQAILKSDSFLGSDASRMVKLKVEDASVLEEHDQEDEISEPEEDSLAGQMALMKGQKVKPSNRDDGADSDDESATDDDVEQNDDDDDSDTDSDSDSD